MKGAALGPLLIVVALILALLGTVLYWELEGYPTLGTEDSRHVR
jgi:hypothetical protein